MNKETVKKLDEAATKAAKEISKFARKANRVLNGKPRKEKKEVGVSEMKTTTLYKSREGKLHRRLDDKKLEVLEKGNWKELKLSFQVLTELKLREC